MFTVLLWISAGLWFVFFLNTVLNLLLVGELEQIPFSQATSGGVRVADCTGDPRGLKPAARDAIPANAAARVAIPGSAPARQAIPGNDRIVRALSAPERPG